MVLDLELAPLGATGAVSNFRDDNIGNSIDHLFQNTDNFDSKMTRTN
jgi:hypothetical protein